MKATSLNRSTSKIRPALRLVSTKELPREDWLQIRKQGIGSSDAAAAVGLNPYKSQLELWLEKTGRDAGMPKADPQDEESPMYWGNVLEPIVAWHYSKRTKNKVRRINAVLQHPDPELPWMLANIDREVIGADDVQILECKTAGINGARLWKEGVPEYVQLQVMHQLAVTGKQAADVAVRTIGALELHVFPVFGKRPYNNILPMEWMEFLRQMEQKGIIEQTSRVRGMCREIYDLARVTGRAQYNPLEGLHKFLQSRPAENYAHVSLDEFPALLRAIRAYGTTDVCIGLQLLAMLACRPSEIREARWEEFDLEAGLWLIPGERMKRRREHLVPLPRQAKELLGELRYLTGAYPLLFPGRSDTTKPRSNTVFLMALRRLGYEGRQTGHGFRHLASTILNENGFDSQHVEAQLSHVKEGVRGVYDKSTYLEQRRSMMQWYADHLDTLAAGNVVDIKRQAKTRG